MTQDKTKNDSRDLLAELAYNVQDMTRPWSYVLSTPRSESEKAAHPIHKVDHGGSMKTVKTRIHDARQSLPCAKLDECGFELSQGWKPSLTHEEYYKLHEPKLVGKLYEEVREYMKTKLGATDVIVFNHQVRNEARADTAGGAVAGYATSQPHTDSTTLSTDQMYLSLLEGNSEYARYKGKGRYMYVHMWKNISDIPIQNNHLAVLDDRTTVKPDDYIEKDLFMDGYHLVLYGLNYRHHKLHKWYYYPAMKNDEMLLFKQVDSDHTKESRTCFHVSVPDNEATDDTPPRESIEIRCIALFPDAELDTVPTKEIACGELMNKNRGMPESIDGVSVLSALGRTISSLFERARYFLTDPSWLPGGLLLFKDYGENDQAISNYVSTLIQGVEAFEKYPANGQAYILGSLYSPDEDTRNENLAKLLVKDDGKTLNLHDKSDEFKQKVAQACCDSMEYRAAVSKHVFTS
eukprot:CAMPEP_0203760992 /NCGR_PEP_ID=MMETSP0098-20131031/14169_1 /ASSEMBLY_ACC=CAM_ASM_000208 /TAXON_ID=96639 /ORGANISM=" , Strain NY0313808BC1" /LENGTH=462 /DNA_ID=CAMNT_0050654791 /DNA_START=1247 /DNA_END=2635 /DNA_ORIENTATION=+